MTDRDIRSISSTSDGAEPAITSLLQRTYAPPSDAAYWAGLERRVLARIRESGPVAWWAFFAEWRSAGLAAAALALVVAGAALVYEQQEMASTRQLAAGAAAYTVFDDSVEGVAVALSTPTRVRLDTPERSLGLTKP